MESQKGVRHAQHGEGRGHVVGLVDCPGCRSNSKIFELYQSQDCSSCPPAISNVNSLVGRPGLLPLTFAVTYWDGLGWKDTFAKPEFANRQYAFRDGLGTHEVYTPQVIVDGRIALVGVEKNELDRKIEAAQPLTGPAITIDKNQISVGGGNDASADIWLVTYDPGPLRVAVGRGENAGTTIEHRNVVRSLIRLGSWLGKPETLHIPIIAGTHWKELIFVQSANGGQILSACESIVLTSRPTWLRWLGLRVAPIVNRNSSLT